jgi:hypothetical protein
MIAEKQISASLLHELTRIMTEQLKEFEEARNQVDAID